MAEIPSHLRDQISRLSPERRALFELKLKERQRRAVDGEGIVRREIRDTAPLTFAQKRFWFFDQFEPEVAINNEWTAVRLRGTLSITALEQSFQAVMRRHEALRTLVVMQDGQPMQRIVADMAASVEVINLRGVEEANRWDEAKRQAQEETLRRFDLARGPLFRAKLFQMAEHDHLLLMTFHHLVIDAWSATIFYRELGSFYNSFLQKQSALLPELSVHYGDFAQWQEKWPQSAAYGSKLAYWKEQLANLSPLQLPTDRPRPAKQTYRGARESIEFSESLLESLRELSQREGASLFMTLLAALQTLLYRYTGQDDIVVGSPIANRNRREVEGLIGCFTNTLALRSQFSGNPSFRELLRQVRTTLLDALNHQDVPFEKLVQELHLARDLSRTPIFQVMLVYNNTALSYQQFDQLHAEPVTIESTVAKFEWTFAVMELDTGFQAYLEYNTDLFDAATIKRVVGHLQTLLAGIVVAPDRRVGDLPLLTEVERRQVLVEWNDTTRPYPASKCIHELFEEQVEKTPDAIAVVFAEQQITYAELNTRANRLAHHLRSLGVGPEVLVGLCVDRSIEMVVGLLAILKAGGGYVPLDPAYPSERIAFMLADADPTAVLTQKHIASIVSVGNANIVFLDDSSPSWATQPDQTPQSSVVPQNVAYVIYTSGSTGRPKGVALQHAGGAAFLSWVTGEFDKETLRGTIASTSISFDVAFFEIFAPLTTGGALLIVRDVLEIDTLSKTIAATLLVTVPSAARILVREGKLPHTLRAANLAGEALDQATADAIYNALPNLQIVRDLYGPTEDTTYSTCAFRRFGEPATIGRAIAYGEAYVLGRSLDVLPSLIAGELYLGGAGLARGYVERPALTAERFLPNPYSSHPGARMYRTGDVARWRSDGNLEYGGRIDHQVKIRGFRIELGEIEAALSSHSSVRACVVVAREDVPGDKRLVAYVVPAEVECKVHAIREHLRTTLPDYMIPSAFVVLDSLPLTPNGKLNRKALPAPELDRSAVSVGYVAARNPTETALVNIWTEVLGIDSIGIYDDFFELGGHSLLATQVISRCRHVFQFEIALIRLFEERTIAGLSLYVESVKLSQELQQTIATASDMREEIAL